MLYLCMCVWKMHDAKKGQVYLSRKGEGKEKKEKNKERGKEEEKEEGKEREFYNRKREISIRDWGVTEFYSCISLRP